MKLPTQSTLLHPADPTPIELPELEEVSGGMRWQDFRPSKNVEDRRPKWAIERDNRWWNQQHAVPLPPRRPPGI